MGRIVLSCGRTGLRRKRHREWRERPPAPPERACRRQGAGTGLPACRSPFSDPPVHRREQRAHGPGGTPTGFSGCCPCVARVGNRAGPRRDPVRRYARTLSGSVRSDLPSGDVWMSAADRPPPQYSTAGIRIKYSSAGAASPRSLSRRPSVRPLIGSRVAMFVYGNPVACEHRQRLPVLHSVRSS